MSGPIAHRDARKTLLRGTAVGAVVVALFVGALEAVWPIGPTADFLLGVLAAFGLFVLVVHRAVDRTGDEGGVEGLTLATGVTILRAGAVATLAGFLVTAPTRPGLEAWLPAALFAVAAGLDAVDGRLARLRGSVTELGARLDVEVDSLAVLVGSALAVAGGNAPPIFLSVGLARYVFVAGLRWRKRRGKAVCDLPPSRVRPLLGAAAMVATWIALLPAVGPGPSRLVTTAVMVPFLLNFARDYLAVAGRL